jgi:hypothetical protein
MILKQSDRGILIEFAEGPQTTRVYLSPVFKHSNRQFPALLTHEGLSVTVGLSHSPQTMTGDRPNEQNTIENQSNNITHDDQSGLVAKPRYASIATYSGKQVGVCLFDIDVVEYTIDEETSKLAVRPRNQ